MNILNNYNVDVLVCGGGTAGAAAAIQAARNGMRTLLIEKRESLGGLCTNGYITGLAGHVDGIGLEWVERLAKKGKAIVRPHLPAVEPENGKVMLETMLINAGCRILYGVHVADCEVKDGHIESVTVYCSAGKMVIKAAIYIDATGDAVLANAAGVPCEFSSAEFFGISSSTSMGFRLSYIDYAKYKEAENEYRKSTIGKDMRTTPISLLMAKQNEAIENGDLPFVIAPCALIYPVVGSNNQACMDVTLDATHTHYCRNDSIEDLTRQIVDQHRKILIFTDFLQKYMPGFENCNLEHFAEMNGTRETRRIIGEYIFTGEDLACGRKFEDGIAIFPEPFDLHHPTSTKGIAKRHIHSKEPLENAHCVPATDCCDIEMHPYVEMDEGYEVRANPRVFSEIPYRSLVAKGVDNLLAAGRCVSADWDAIGAIRIIATCFTMGQAAGNAASVCVKRGILPKEVNGAEIREMQKKQGVPLDQPLEGYWAHARDMEGEYVVANDMTMIVSKDGRTSFQG